MNNSGASVVTQPAISYTIGGSLAEKLFDVPMQGLVRCSECSTPVFEVVGDCIHIISRHHGDKHHTIIPLASLGLRLE